MNPETPNYQPDNKPEATSNGGNGVPTIDPLTGSVSIQPVATEPLQSSTLPDVVPQTGAGPMVMPPADRSKRRWVLPAVIAGVFAVLLATGYVFGMYLPNRPSALYAKSLERSGQAIDALVNYTDDYAKKNYKAYNIDGSMHFTSSSGSMDATVKGDFDKDYNGSVAVKVNVMGEKIAADIRSVDVDGSASPDVYVRLSGIKPILDEFGASSMSGLDGQWISFDHTILDTYAASLAETEVMTNATAAPTDAQIHDAVLKVQQVNKQYIFTADSSKAVFKQSKYVGKESKDDRSVYHYKVGYDKVHLQAYVSALGVALDNSKLNDWVKSANDGKKVSEVMDFKDLESSVKDAKTDYTFDVWVDAETKLVHQIQFADPSDSHGTFTLAQNYTGGDDYPFAMTMSSMVDGTSENASMKFNINKKTDVGSGELSVKSGSTNGTFTFTVKPSNDSVKVTAPSGATSVMSLLSQLGLGSTTSEYLTPELESLNSGLMSL